MNKNPIRPLILLLFLLGFVAAQPATQSANTYAQSNANPWTRPINLSQSGGTSDPTIVIDSNNAYHVIWLDSSLGYVFTRGDGTSWSFPEIGAFPFAREDSTPKLIAASTGSIIAAWINADDDLYISQISASSFGTINRWSPPFRLATSVEDFALEIDEQDILHILFLRTGETEEQPAGIYYRRSTNLGAAWSNPFPIYISPYFRSILPQEAKIVLEVKSNGESTSIFALWDNRARRRIFFSASDDGGLTWREAQAVVGPSDALSVENPAPFHGELISNSQGLLLTWHQGQPDIICDTRSKWSDDFGITWSPSQNVPSEISGCPADSRLITGTNDILILYSNIFEQSYLTAWNGNTWSKAFNQDELFSFIDEDTKASVDFRCHEFLEGSNEELIVVGCDIGSGSDIWFFQRDIGQEDDWYPSFDAWTEPSIIYNGADLINSPLLISDQHSQLHSIWVEGKDIFYTRYSDENWLAPAVIIQKQGLANIQLATEVDKQGRLHVVYSGGQSGEIFYSWANVDRAISKPEWSDPFRLPMPDFAGGPPDIIVDDLGRILVVYPIPLNENRGVYFNFSSNDGADWSEPIQVFDAASVGWEMVDHPKISFSPDGWIHVIWTQETIPNGIGPLALYYGSSGDGGLTWNEPAMLSDNPILWSDIVVSEDNLVHILWQEEDNNRLQVKHLYSDERTGQWIQGGTVSSLGDIPGLLQLTVDREQNPLIVQITEGVPERMHILLWRWEGSRWVSDPILDLGDRTLLDINSLAAAVSFENMLGALYTGQNFPIRFENKDQYLFFTQRRLSADFIVEIPEDRPTLFLGEPEATLEAGPPDELEVTPLPTEPTMISNLPSQQPGATGILSSPFAGLLIGGVLSSITVGLFFIINRFRNKM